MQQTQAATGLVPADLRTPPAPAGLVYLLAAFRDMAASRGSNGFGPSPLSLLEIDAWCRLSGTALAWWEVQAVRQMDQAFLAVWAQARPQGE